MTPQQRDLIIRTIAAEASGKSPEEAQAIGHVIMNRITSGRYGKTPEKVLFAPKQFEPWGDPRGSNYPMRHKPGTRKYEMAQAALDAALAKDDLTGGATLFWAPKAQAALGRPAPRWGRTGGLDIGETRFHRDDGGMVEEREGHGSGSRVVSKALEALRAPAISRVNPTEAADQVAFLLRNGRGNEVTNALAGAADPNTLLQHYLSGGTGAEMPMTQAARIGRAKEMGYHTEKPYYHAGDPKTAFDNSRGELYVTTDKPFAEAYQADKDYGSLRSLLSRHQNTIEADDVIDFFHNKVSSLDPSGVNLKYGWEAFNPDLLAGIGGNPRDAAKLLPALKREGFDSAFFPEDFPPTSSYTDPSSSRAIFYPETLRDISARFDPRLSHVSDLDYASGGTVEREGHAGGEAVGKLAKYLRSKTPEMTARDIAGLLRAGRSPEVTDSMLGQADPRLLHELYASGKTGVEMPMDYAARMKRATELGYDQPMYRGTQAREALNRSLQTERSGEGKTSGTGAWLSDNPDIAATYSGYEEFGPVTLPLLARSTELQQVLWGGNLWSQGPEGMTTDQVARLAREQGARGIAFPDVTDVGPHLWSRADLQKRIPETATSFSIFDPSIVRSPFARFDPRLDDHL
jgi:hypothetical protein